MTASAPRVGIGTLFVSALAILACLPAVGAEPPAGIIMAVTGATTPPLREMAEIPAGEQVQLGAGAALTFLHYSRCKLVTVTGGTLVLSRFDYRTDGQITREAEAPCPRVYSVKDARTGATAGGMVMRGGGSAQRWPFDFEIAFVGDRARHVQAATVYADEQPNRPFFRFDLHGQKARKPIGAPAIVSNGRYVLRLSLNDQPGPIDISFVGTAATRSDALVILRVD